MNSEILYSYDFCKAVADILVESGIDIDAVGIAKSASSGEYTNADFRSFVDNLVVGHLISFCLSGSVPTPEQLSRSLTKISFNERSFYASYISDLPLLKDNKIVNAEFGNLNSLIITLFDGSCYRMKADSIRSELEYGSIPFTKIEGHLANSYFAEDLLNSVSNILRPLLIFDHGERLNEDMHNEISQLLPFNPHFDFQNDIDIYIIEAWEEQIKSYKDCKMTRDTVQRIIDFLYDNLIIHYNPYSISDWNILVGEAIVKLRSL